MRTDRWWRSAVIYQIYPRSFADSNGDGIGDLRGIITHLDYLADLGINAVWLSPVYPSPGADAGYDVADYRGIDPLFGTDADFDELIAGLHARGIRLVMDVVFNHTSIEHPWFVDSRSSREAAKRDWYLWRDARPGCVAGQPGAEPNNWESIFGGPAWTYHPATGQYYLNLFTPEQPDLNWENPLVRAELADVLRFWLGRGVDGFRMDVINFVSKDPAYPDGRVGPSGLGDGYPYFSNGPRIHEFLAELRAAVGPDVLLIAEAPGVTVHDGELYTDPARGEVDMLFQFEHVGLDSAETKWDPRPLQLAELVENLRRWQLDIGDGWNALYWSNHDQPRVVSRFGDPAYWRESATALATLLHLLRGTPFVYQGEELGTTNFGFTSPDEFQDIEALNAYSGLLGRGLTAVDAMARVSRMSRDNARIPIAWDASPSGGFTTGTPWLPLHPERARVNAAVEADDPDSVLAYYRRLIALRHREPVIALGRLESLELIGDSVVRLVRTGEGSTIEAFINLSGAPQRVAAEQGRVLLANLPLAGDWLTLAPWQAVVLDVFAVGDLAPAVRRTRPASGGATA